jgi:hypothetical protein
MNTILGEKLSIENNFPISGTFVSRPYDKKKSGKEKLGQQHNNVMKNTCLGTAFS